MPSVRSYPGQVELGEPRSHKPIASAREALLATLKNARATLAEMEQQAGVDRAALQWHRGYVKAVEEMLDLEAISLRRHRRRSVFIAADVRGIPEDAASAWEKGTVISLSRSGAELVTRVALSVGARIELAFILPGGATPVRHDGWVRRLRRAGEETRVGIEFGEELPTSGEPDQEGLTA